VSGTTAFVFPGQGSQKVGMGRDWADAHEVARRTFEEADEELGFALSRLCWEGPEDELTLTANTQPALLTTSVAIHRVLVEHGVTPSAVAGHSLGEYSALVAAGTLGFADALRLVRRRGEAMQEAVPPGVGAMAAVLGLSLEEVAAVAEAASEPAGESNEKRVCSVANDNAPGQVVLAGHAEVVDRAVELARQRGARRAILLEVSAPFHCSLMRPARQVMEELLAATPFADPRVPVVTNVDAAPVTSGAAARDALIRQIDGRVRWTESVQRLAADGVTDFLEVGPGKVLTGLIRRIVEGARTHHLAAAEQLPEVLAGLRGGETP